MNTILVKTPTVGDLYQFILKNKKNKVFSEYDNRQIVTLIMNGLMDKTLYYAQDKEGNITGMILAEVQKSRKTVFVMENLAMNLTNLRAFAMKAREQFRGYYFQGYKRDRYIDYTKLTQRIS